MHLLYLASRSRYLSLLILMCVSAASLLVHIQLFPYPAPESVWGDHYWYWTQADEWLRVNDPLTLEPEPAAYLKDLYGTVSYASEENSPAFQPPYIYRPLAPVLAGIFGHALGIEYAFLVLSITSSVAFGVFAGLAVRNWTGSLVFAAFAAATALWLPTAAMRFVVQRFATVDIEALAIVALVLWLLSSNRILAASVVAAILGSLAREPLAVLALCVAIYAWIIGRSRLWYWALAVLAPLIQVGLRLLLPVVQEQSIADVAVTSNPLQAAYLYIDAFGYVLLVSFGLVVGQIRIVTASMLPMLLVLFGLNSSLLAVPRTWLTWWPVLLILGLSGASLAVRGLWWRWSFLVVLASTMGSAIGYDLGLVSSRSIVWICVILGLVWVAAWSTSFLASNRKENVGAEASALASLEVSPPAGVWRNQRNSRE